MIRENCFAGLEPCADLIRALTTVNMPPTHIHIDKNTHKPLLWSNFNLSCINDRQLFLDLCESRVFLVKGNIPLSRTLFSISTPGGMWGTRGERVSLSPSLHWCPIYLKNVPSLHAVTQKIGSSLDNNQKQPVLQLGLQPRWHLPHLVPITLQGETFFPCSPLADLNIKRLTVKRSEAITLRENM